MVSPVVVDYRPANLIFLIDLAPRGPLTVRLLLRDAIPGAVGLPATRLPSVRKSGRWSFTPTSFACANCALLWVVKHKYAKEVVVRPNSPSLTADRGIVSIINRIGYRRKHFKEPGRRDIRVNVCNGLFSRGRLQLPHSSRRLARSTATCQEDR